MNKRILSAVMAGCMLLSLSACNNQNDDRVDPTSRETETQITPDVSDPPQSIADSLATTESESSEATNPAQSGAYTYEAYGYKFSMNINIDDYIFVSEVTGNTCFGLYTLAEDLGWRPHRANGDSSYTLDSDQPVEWYEYDFGDSNIMMIYLANDGGKDNPLNRKQINMISYEFAEYPIPYDVHSGTKCYDSDMRSNPQYYTSIISVPKHSSDSDWLSLAAGPHFTGALSREDAIIIAYLFAVGPQHPGENPFYYSDFIDSGYDTPTSGEYKLPY
ncbi:MAG: hypothetical protein SPL61_04000 [Saccharofermentans sp.]|nr:hypothetical protein [Saccharofermentans sp.]